LVVEDLRDPVRMAGGLQELAQCVIGIRELREVRFSRMRDELIRFTF
jgi:hypothetical protein